MEDLKKHIEALIAKSAETAESGDAMRYSQAAVNAANAMCSLHEALNSARN